MFTPPDTRERIRNPAVWETLGIKPGRLLAFLRSDISQTNRARIVELIQQCQESVSFYSSCRSYKDPYFCWSYVLHFLCRITCSCQVLYRRRTCIYLLKLNKLQYVQNEATGTHLAQSGVRKIVYHILLATNVVDNGSGLAQILIVQIRSMRLTDYEIP